MADIAEGATLEVQGSGSKPYILKNVGGVYSCSCPAWRNQSGGVIRTCKHLKKVRGEAAEAARLAVPQVVHPVPQLSVTDSDKMISSISTAPPILLANSWDNEQDLTGWWMSEKLDGVRAYWDGEKFLSRLGNVYHAPDWFTKWLPKHPFDGELWMGRKCFQQTISIVRRQDKSALWEKIRFVVFDAPSAGAGTPQGWLPFEERVQIYTTRFEPLRALPRDPGFIVPHPHIRCNGVDHLRQELARIEALGGEGLMLRQPGSRYIAGRSPTLLKVKSFHDAEARVTGYTAGKGRHKGTVGALEVVLPNGIAFSVGTGLSDQDRRTPPPIGSKITFRYQELTNGGVPRFPSFVGIRID